MAKRKTEKETRGEKQNKNSHLKGNNVITKYTVPTTPGRAFDVKHRKERRNEGAGKMSPNEEKELMDASDDCIIISDSEDETPTEPQDRNERRDEGAEDMSHDGGKHPITAHGNGIMISDTEEDKKIRTKETAPAVTSYTVSSSRGQLADRTGVSGDQTLRPETLKHRKKTIYSKDVEQPHNTQGLKGIAPYVKSTAVWVTPLIQIPDIQPKGNPETPESPKPAPVASKSTMKVTSQREKTLKSERSATPSNDRYFQISKTQGINITPPLKVKYNSKVETSVVPSETSIAGPLSSKFKPLNYLSVSHLLSASFEGEPTAEFNPKVPVSKNLNISTRTETLSKPNVGGLLSKLTSNSKSVTPDPKKIMEDYTKMMNEQKSATPDKFQTSKTRNKKVSRFSTMKDKAGIPYQQAGEGHDGHGASKKVSDFTEEFTKEHDIEEKQPFFEKAKDKNDNILDISNMGSFEGESFLVEPSKKVLRDSGGRRDAREPSSSKDSGPQLRSSDNGDSTSRSSRTRKIEEKLLQNWFSELGGQSVNSCPKQQKKFEKEKHSRVRTKSDEMKTKTKHQHTRNSSPSQNDEKTRGSQKCESLGESVKSRISKSSNDSLPPARVLSVSDRAIDDFINEVNLKSSRGRTSNKVFTDVSNSTVNKSGFKNSTGLERSLHKRKKSISSSKSPGSNHSNSVNSSPIFLPKSRPPYSDSSDVSDLSDIRKLSTNSRENSLDRSPKVTPSKKKQSNSDSENDPKNLESTEEVISSPKNQVPSDEAISKVHVDNVATETKSTNKNNGFNVSQTITRNPSDAGFEMSSKIEKQSSRKRSRDSSSDEKLGSKIARTFLKIELNEKKMQNVLDSVLNETKKKSRERRLGEDSPLSRRALFTSTSSSPVRHRSMLREGPDHPLTKMLKNYSTNYKSPIKHQTEEGERMRHKKYNSSRKSSGPEPSQTHQDSKLSEKEMPDVLDSNIQRSPSPRHTVPQTHSEVMNPSVTSDPDEYFSKSLQSEKANVHLELINPPVTSGPNDELTSDPTVKNIITATEEVDKNPKYQPLNVKHDSVLELSSLKVISRSKIIVNPVLASDEILCKQSDTAPKSSEEITSSGGSKSSDDSNGERDPRDRVSHKAKSSDCDDIIDLTVFEDDESHEANHEAHESGANNQDESHHHDLESNPNGNEANDIAHDSNHENADCHNENPLSKKSLTSGENPDLLKNTKNDQKCCTGDNPDSNVSHDSPKRKTGISGTEEGADASESGTDALDETDASKSGLHVLKSVTQRLEGPDASKSGTDASNIGSRVTKSSTDALAGKMASKSGSDASKCVTDASKGSNASKSGSDAIDGDSGIKTDHGATTSFQVLFDLNADTYDLESENECKEIEQSTNETEKSNSTQETDCSLDSVGDRKIENSKSSNFNENNSICPNLTNSATETVGKISMFDISQFFDDDSDALPNDDDQISDTEPETSDELPEFFPGDEIADSKNKNEQSGEREEGEDTGLFDELPDLAKSPQSKKRRVSEKDLRSRKPSLVESEMMMSKLLSKTIKTDEFPQDSSDGTEWIKELDDVVITDPRPSRNPRKRLRSLDQSSTLRPQPSFSAILADTAFSRSYKKHGASLKKLVREKKKENEVDKMEKILLSDLKKGGFRKTLEKAEHSDGTNETNYDEETKRAVSLMKKDWGTLPHLSPSSQIFRRKKLNYCHHNMALKSCFSPQDLEALNPRIRKVVFLRLVSTSTPDISQSTGFLNFSLNESSSRIQTYRWMLDALPVHPNSDIVHQIIQKNIRERNFNKAPFRYSSLANALTSSGIDRNIFSETLDSGKDVADESKHYTICEDCLRRRRKTSPRNVIGIVKVCSTALHVHPLSLTQNQQAEFAVFLLLLLQDETFIAWSGEIMEMVSIFLRDIKEWESVKYEIARRLIEFCKRLNVMQEITNRLHFNEERSHELCRIISFAVLKLHVFGEEPQPFEMNNSTDPEALVDIVDHFNPDNLEVLLTPVDAEEQIGDQKRTYYHLSLLLPLLNVCIGDECNDQPTFVVLDRIWAILRTMNKRIRDNGAIYRSQVKYELSLFTKNLRNLIQKAPKQNKASIFKYLRSAPVKEEIVDNSIEEIDSSDTDDVGVSYNDDNEEIKGQVQTHKFSSKSNVELDDEFKLAEVIKSRIIGSAGKN